MAISPFKSINQHEAVKKRRRHHLAATLIRLAYPDTAFFVCENDLVSVDRTQPEQP